MGDNKEMEVSVSYEKSKSQSFSGQALNTESTEQLTTLLTEVRTMRTDLEDLKVKQNFIEDSVASLEKDKKEYQNLSDEIRTTKERLNTIYTGMISFLVSLLSAAFLLVGIYSVVTKALDSFYAGHDLSDSLYQMMVLIVIAFLVTAGIIYFFFREARKFVYHEDYKNKNVRKNFWGKNSG